MGPQITSSTAMNTTKNNPEDHVDKKIHKNDITVLEQLRGDECTPRKQKQRPEGNTDGNWRYENGINKETELLGKSQTEVVLEMKNSGSQVKSSAERLWQKGPVEGSQDWETKEGNWITQ